MADRNPTATSRNHPHFYPGLPRKMADYPTFPYTGHESIQPRALPGVGEDE